MDAPILTADQKRQRTINIHEKEITYHRKRAVMWRSEKREDLATWHEKTADEITAEVAVLKAKP